MKKIVASLIVAATLVSLTACGSRTDVEEKVCVLCRETKDLQ
jgi:hypothetical protein